MTCRYVSNGETKASTREREMAGFGDNQSTGFVQRKRKTFISSEHLRDMYIRACKPPDGS